MPNNTKSSEPDYSQFKFAEHKFEPTPLEKLVDRYLTDDEGAINEDAKAVAIELFSYTSAMLASAQSGTIAPEMLWSGVINVSARIPAIPFYRQHEAEIKAIEGMIATEAFRAIQGKQSSVQAMSMLAAAFPTHLIALANNRDFVKAAAFRDELDEILRQAAAST